MHTSQLISELELESLPRQECLQLLGNFSKLLQASQTVQSTTTKLCAAWWTQCIYGTWTGVCECFKSGLQTPKIHRTAAQQLSIILCTPSHFTPGSMSWVLGTEDLQIHSGCLLAQSSLNHFSWLVTHQSNCKHFLAWQVVQVEFFLLCSGHRTIKKEKRVLTVPWMRFTVPSISHWPVFVSASKLCYKRWQHHTVWYC